MTRREPRRWAVHALIAAIGRRNTVRLARLLQNEARLDVPNDMSHNGELMVQRRVLQRVGPQQSVSIADVGANVGLWTMELVSQLRGARVGGHVSIHAFEPDKSAATQFRANTSTLRNVTILLNEVAISDREGEGVFHLTGPGAGTNSLHLSPDARREDRTERVTLTTLDDYAQTRGVEHFVLVKVDTEGHDFRVMQGAQQLMRSGRIDVMQFEYNHRWVAARSFLRDVFDLVRPIGYRVGKVTPKGIEFYEEWHPELETFREGNYLVCRPEWANAFDMVVWWNRGG